jgi:hypothetical protein
MLLEEATPFVFEAFSRLAEPLYVKKLLSRGL